MCEILDQHPALLTVEELVLSQTAGSDRELEPELWKRAIDGLCRYGVLRCSAQGVLEPTVAAIRVSELLEMRP